MFRLCHILMSGSVLISSVAGWLEIGHVRKMHHMLYMFVVIEM